MVSSVIHMVYLALKCKQTLNFERNSEGYKTEVYLYLS